MERVHQAVRRAFVSEAKSDIGFRVGDHLVHPHHGVAVLVRRERRKSAGSTARDYLVLRVVGADLRVLVPVDAVQEIGVRAVMSADEAEEVLRVLNKPVRIPGNWSRRFKNHTEKLRSGDIHEIVVVLRNLWVLNERRKLSAAEEKMLVRARELVVPELMLALGQSQAEFDERLDDLMARRPTLGDRLAS